MSEDFLIAAYIVCWVVTSFAVLVRLWRRGMFDDIFDITLLGTLVVIACSVWPILAVCAAIVGLARIVAFGGRA